MNKEEIANISQLLNGMRELAKKLDVAIKKNDMEDVFKVKKEILTLWSQLDGII